MFHAIGLLLLGLLHRLRHRIHLAHLESHAHDGAAHLFLSVVYIRRGDDGAVGQKIQAGGEAVFEGLEQADAIPARFVIKRGFFRKLR